MMGNMFQPKQVQQVQFDDFISNLEQAELEQLAKDMALQEEARRLDGLAQRLKPRELEARAEIWAPLRSVASWALWRSSELDWSGEAP